MLGQPTILTVCPEDSCTLNTFPGIDGLVVGTVLPAYGSMVRFGDRVFTTAFDTNSAVGYSLHFNAQSILMQRGLNPDCTFALLLIIFISVPRFNFVSHLTACTAQPFYPSTCGTYNDNICRGAASQANVGESDNVIRTLTLYGDQYGQFVLNQSMYPYTDRACAIEATISSTIIAYGTFSVHGASDCGGQCVVCHMMVPACVNPQQNSSAQQIEFSLAYALVTAYDLAYLNDLNVSHSFGQQHLTCFCRATVSAVLSGSWECSVLLLNVLSALVLCWSAACRLVRARQRLGRWCASGSV